MAVDKNSAADSGMSNGLRYRACRARMKVAIGRQGIRSGCGCWCSSSPLLTRAVTAICLIVLWGCSSGLCSPNPYLRLSGGEIADVAKSLRGDPYLPMSIDRQWIGEAVCAAVERGEDGRDLVESGCWLTAAQRGRILGLRTPESRRFMEALALETGWYREEQAHENVVESSAAVGFLPLSWKPDFEDAAFLMMLAEGGKEDSWPNDNDTVLNRLFAQYPDRICSALTRSIRSHDAALASWVGVSLLRLRSIGSNAATHSYDMLNGDAIQYRIDPTVWSEARRRGFSVGLRYCDDPAEVLAAAHSESMALEFWAGYWAAATMDPSGLPRSNGEFDAMLRREEIASGLAQRRNGLLLTRLATLQGRRDPIRLLKTHLTGKLASEEVQVLLELKQSSQAALAILAEDGDRSAAADLFWGIEVGVPEVGRLIEGDYLEAMWRSGYIVQALASALHLGGGYVRCAQFWMKDCNVLNMDLREFEQEIRAMILPEAQVQPVRSWATGRWLLLPKSK